MSGDTVFRRFFFSSSLHWFRRLSGPYPTVVQVVEEEDCNVEKSVSFSRKFLFRGLVFFVRWCLDNGLKIVEEGKKIAERGRASEHRETIFYCAAVKEKSVCAN